MKQIQYKDFSFKYHHWNWLRSRFNTCQFELTFACPLHCAHCYTDCYNNRKDIKKELSTKQVIQILDKLYNSGIFWLCFTGGDPLIRRDFIEIYTHAKKRGFIITIFASGAVITEEIADYFKKMSPFCIEVTLNSVTRKTYEEISNVGNSFDRTMAGISRLKKRNIPLKIRTIITKQNYSEINEIREFAENLGLNLKLGNILFPRLNGDMVPYNLRLKPEEILEANKRFETDIDRERACVAGKKLQLAVPQLKRDMGIFPCAAGIDTFHIDPYGNMFLCTTMRKPSISLLKNDIADGFALFKRLRAKKFKRNFQCKNCSIRYLCYNCPGKAKLEIGDEEASIDYFCKLAHLAAEKENILCPE